MNRFVAIVVLGALAAPSCERSPAPQAEATTAAPPPSAAPAGSASATAGPEKPSLDAPTIASITGAKAEATDGVVKVSFPRDDVKVAVDGWEMPPFMGLTSWAAFTPGEKPGVEAMVMGDLVLLEDEVSAAMSALLDGGVAVTALHNHFFYDKPRVFFMHVGGEGRLEVLAKGVRAGLDAAKAVRARSPRAAEKFDGPALPAKSSIDPAKVEAAIGHKGSAKDGMVKVTIGRPAAQAACGCKIGKVMGVNTWAAFAGTDDDAIVDGDVAVAEGELQSVLKELRRGGVHVVAIHHHMVGETPRILFVHYWGRGAVDALGKTLAAAIAQTKTEG